MFEITSIPFPIPIDLIIIVLLIGSIFWFKYNSIRITKLLLKNYKYFYKIKNGRKLSHPKKYAKIKGRLIEYDHSDFHKFSRISINDFKYIGFGKHINL